jgi:hypothetical protein
VAVDPDDSFLCRISLCVVPDYFGPLEIWVLKYFSRDKFFMGLHSMVGAFFC